MIDKKWVKVVGIAMGLPSTIFIAGWGTMQLVKMNILSKPLAVSLFLAIIGNSIFMMVYHAYKTKK